MSLDSDKPQRIFRLIPIRYLFGQAPSGIPRAFWKRVRWLRFVLIGGTVAPLTVVLFFRLSLRIAIFVAVGAFLLIRFIAAWRARLFAERMRGDDYQRCVNCGYSLSGLPSSHGCPKCGTRYQLDVVRRTWISFLGAQGAGIKNPLPDRVCQRK